MDFAGCFVLELNGIIEGMKFSLHSMLEISFVFYFNDNTHKRDNLLLWVSYILYIFQISRSMLA